MKLKKILMAILILLMSFSGALFACKEKPITITSVDFETGEEIVDSIKLGILNDASNLGEESQGDEELDDEDDESQSAIKNSTKIIIKPSKEDKIFDLGLNVKVSKNNVLDIKKENQMKEGGYVYTISAIFPENVTITFETIDKKAQTQIKVEVTQEVEEIESNGEVARYIVLGTDQTLSENLVKFYPETTTEREVKYALQYDYEGIKLENNKIIFTDPEDPYVKLNGENQSKISIVATHNKYSENLSEEDKSKLKVENIEFDILYSVGEIVAIRSDEEKFEVSKIDSFASNLTAEQYMTSKISIRRKVVRVEGDGEQVDYININETYKLEHYFIDENNNVIDDSYSIISFEPDTLDPFTITLNQKQRSGKTTLVIRAVNTIQNEYKSNEIKISIEVKDYPTYISINGDQNPEEIILYDDGQRKELLIEIGAENCFNTKFTITNIQTSQINLTYSSGTQVVEGTSINSKTKLYLSCANYSAIISDEQGAFTITSEGLQTLTKTISYRIVKSLKEVTVSLDGVEITDEKTLSKTDDSGNFSLYTFVITSKDNIYIPTFKVRIENELICSLENINYSQSNKSFTIRTLTAGSTNILITFDNNLTKTFKISVYTPISSFLVDITEESKNNLGLIEYKTLEDDDLLNGQSTISSFALKKDKSIKLQIKTFDLNKKIILDESIISVKYELNKNNANIAVDNTKHIVDGLRETTQPVEVEIEISAYGSDGTIFTVSRTFSVSVYIPINNLVVNKDYISLYTEESLGDKDKNLSESEIEVTFNPENGTFAKFEKINYEANFITGVKINIQKINQSNSFKIKITAKELENIQTTTGTILFSIQEYNSIYTKEVVVKITQAVTPEKVLFENVDLLKDEEGNQENYLYFNLGLSEGVKINPRVYPLNSYNIDYDVRIENSSTGIDPISFDRKTGLILPTSVGECDLVLLPKAFKTNTTSETRIRIFVADGEEIPYKISTKEEFLKLCSRQIVPNSETANYEQRYSKKYVLTSDIDLSGETIYPIGIYCYENASHEYVLKKVSFTGAFDGEFKINKTSQSFKISGLSININYGGAYLIKENKDNNSYLGLFVKNEGSIKNLDVYYVQSIVNLSSSSEGYSPNSAINNVNFYLGGISAVNAGYIYNCKVNLSNLNIKTYYSQNFIGAISGINIQDETNIGKIEKCSASGNLNILDAYVIYSQETGKTVSTSANFTLGGLVGQNESDVLGSFNTFEDINTQIFNKDIIDSKVNITNNYNGEQVFGENGYFGGVVGINKGVVQNISAYSFVFGSNIVGGLVGQNEGGTIKNSLTASSVMSNDIIGGLVGKSTNGIIESCAVMLLDDEENIITQEGSQQLYTKLFGKNISGLVGTLSGTTLTNNFVRSYVIKETNSYDALALGGTFYPLINNNTNSSIGTNFADNLKVKDNNGEANISDSIAGIGVSAPISINAKIYQSTLSASERGKNRFLSLGNNNDKILLYYYNDDSYNYYISKYIYKIEETYEEGSTGTKLSLLNVESSNSDILKIDSNGNFTVKKTGEVEIRIYSLLNRNASTTIKVKIINEINTVQIYKDSLEKNIVGNSLLIEKDKSDNIYFNSQIRQDDIYLKYDISSYSSLVINSVDNAEGKYFSSQNAQVLTGKTKGTIALTVSCFVKVDDEYFEIPQGYNVVGEIYTIIPLSYSFNVTISEGLKNFYTNFEEASIVQNASLGLELNIETDLVNNTRLEIEQKIDGENLADLVYQIEQTKDESENLVTYNIQISVPNEKVNELVGKTVDFKVYAYDSFVTLSMIKQNEVLYSKYIKNIKITVESSNLISLEMSYFADGEISKNKNGNDVINENEFESNFIKIGKMGLLKINAYPIESIKDKNVIVTYTNSDNYNLNFQQVKKSGNSYEIVSSYSLISGGIKLDTSEKNISDNYLYVKLLTDSPIKTGSEFKLKVQIGDSDYYYEKTLTSKLASNLDISYYNAVLNKEGYLEGVYAKGVSDKQIVSVFVSSLNAYAGALNTMISGNNQLAVSVDLLNKIVIDEDITRYDFTISGLENAGENITLQFYVDKVVNGKTERYLSTKLKLNVVDYIVTGVNIVDCDSGYINKPLGSSFGLRVKLETINVKDTDISNNIADLEEKISKANIWFYNNTSLSDVANENFIITKQDGYFMFSANKTFRLTGFSSRFKITYNSNGQVSYIVDSSTSLGSGWIYDDGVATRYVNGFGIYSYVQTDKNNPVPIYTQEEFENMQTGNNYILLNDLELNDYSPKEATFESFDGNGYVIKINNFVYNDETIENELDFGLFTQISEDSLVKNVTLEFGTKQDSEFEVNSDGKQLNFSNVKTLTFGSIAGVNNGLIYNCFVKTLTINGRENILYINLINLLENEQTTGYIGSFVGKNNGVISNSRSELKIGATKGFLSGFVSENNGTITSSYVKNAIIKNFGEDETKSTTAGFVNINSGKVKYCFVEGNSNVSDNGRYQSDGLLSDYCLQAPTSVGGFVFNNIGSIEDSYSNLSITSQSYSGGFAFTTTGSIIRCYSACIDEQENNTAHAPFLATKIVYNATNLKDKIVNCYYLNINKSSINDDIVKGLSLENFKDYFYFADYIFEEESVWMIESGKLPSLYEANNIALSKRALTSTEILSSGSVKYNYSYISGYMGDETNPIIISNEEEFIYYFESNEMINNYYYRIINDINFSDYSNLPTSKTTFGGVLDGNGLEISNLSISAESNYSKDSFGLFAEIKQTNREGKTLIKNLTIKPSEVYANNVCYVGSLAGKVVSANIYNIKVEANNVVVQGANIVGGVVGKVEGDSKLVNIESNISVNANYHSNINIYIANDDGDNANEVSYAGAICGLVDINENNEGNEPIRDIKVNSGAKVIGNFVGFAFGGIMENSSVSKVKVTVNSNQYLNANFASGIVVGENRGYLSTIETLKESDNLSLFKNNSYFCGGVVGFNNTGTIVNAILNVDIENLIQTNISVGGVAGLSVGGKFSSIYTNIKLNSPKSVGGIVGFASIKENIIDTRVITIENYNDFTPTSNIVLINNTLIQNTSFAIENQCYSGTLFGIIHNKTKVEDGELSLEKEFGYIVENSYYVSSKDGENLIGLVDFGASGGSDLSAGNISVNDDNINVSANKVEKITSKHFSTWSKGLFDISEISKNEETIIVPIFKNSNSINSKNIEGSGTFDSPYQISSLNGLNQLAEIVKNNSDFIYVSLTDNIEATGKLFTTISDSKYNFNGRFEGNNFYINGLSYKTNTNNTANYFGLFGYVASSSVIRNLNIVADFEINFGSKAQYVGVVAGYNKGYISNCKVFGGISAKIANTTNEQSGNVSYIGSIAGINAGDQNSGNVNCENYAFITAKVEEGSNVENIKIFAGLIAGANINEAVINKCKVANKGISLLNPGMKYLDGENIKDYYLVVQNVANPGCESSVGAICGYKASTSTVYDDIADPTYIYVG